jgi:hypothetical protein
MKRAPNPTRQKTEWHEFDVEGRVRARPHVNPDGSLGGWVANTAHVDPSAFLAPEACVFGRGGVEGSARLLDTSSVRDTARVRASAVLAGGASATGNAIVQGSAFIRSTYVRPLSIIGGDARIEHVTHYFLGYLGDVGCRWTAFRGINGIHWLSIEEDIRTLDAWRAYAAQDPAQRSAWPKGLASILQYVDAQECVKSW